MKKLIVKFCIIGLPLLSIAQVQIGSLDKSFGVNGKVIKNVGGLSNSIIKTQPDGKIIVAGTSDSIFLVRYNILGNIDYSFGDNGLVKFALDGDYNLNDIEIMQDGKIFILAFYQTGGPKKPVYIRYNSNGIIDSNFGVYGRLYVNNYFPNGSSLFASDGRIIMSDRSGYNAITQDDFWLMKADINGKPDNSFGIKGEVKTDLGNKNQDIVNKIVLQSDGKILAVGSTRISTTDETDFGMIRYNYNGTIDTNFGKNGIVTYNLSMADEWTDIVIQPNGKIIVSGNVNVDSVGKMNFIVARYNEDGSLDNTFGDNGKTIIWFNTYTRDIANSVLLQPDGKIIVAGMSGEIFFYNNFALARLNANGIIDSTFGLNGKVTTKFTDDDASTDMLLCNDGNIILNGHSGSNVALAKYLIGFNLGVYESKFNTKSIILYPNPAHNELNIALNNNSFHNLQINIYDCLGHLIRQLIITDEMQLKQISISDLETGLYFIECVNDNIKKVNKFIKE